MKGKKKPNRSPPVLSDVISLGLKLLVNAPDLYTNAGKEGLAPIV